MTPTVPSGLDQIISTFGNIDDPRFEQNCIVPFAFPYTMKYVGKIVKTGRCHYMLKETFEAVFEKIKKEGLQYSANDYDGCYAKRSIRGHSSHASTHSWGIAIDLEGQDNPLGSKGKMDPGVVRIFKDFGFFWGGKFKSRFDPMHFQYVKNY